MDEQSYQPRYATGQPHPRDRSSRPSGGAATPPAASRVRPAKWDSPSSLAPLVNIVNSSHGKESPRYRGAVLADMHCVTRWRHKLDNLWERVGRGNS